MFLADARADRGVAAGILVVHADEIGGETAVVVDVGLAVRHPDRVPKFAELRFLPGGNERFKVARQQFECGGMVICRRGNRQAVFRVGGQAQPVVVGLNTIIAVAGHAAVPRLDERQEAAARLASFDPRIDRNDELMLGRFGPDAVERFAELRVGFASQHVMDSGGSHEIPFVGCVDEHLRAENPSAFGGDLRDAPVAFSDRSEALIEIDGRFRLVDHLEKDFLGHARFEGPHGLEGFAVRGPGLGAAASFEVLITRLE